MAFKFNPFTGKLDVVTTSLNALVSTFTKGSVMFIDASGQLAEDNANLFWDDTNKRLGIGIIPLVPALHVNGGDLWATNTADNVKLLLGESTTGAGGSWGGIQWNIGTDTLGIGTSVNINTITINEDEKVGIGVTDPKGKLQVNDTRNAITGTDVDISELAVKVTRAIDANGTGTGIGFSITTSTSSVGAAIIHEREGSQSQGKLHFATKEANTGGTNIPIRMTIEDTGEVGIGITTPITTLDVNGGFAANLTSQTGTYIALTTDHTIICGAGNETFTVTLPAASGVSGIIYNIKNIGTGTITIDGNSAETIDGATTQDINNQYDSITIQCDGSNWHII